MIAAGADYLKIDSCGAHDQLRSEGFAEYAVWRDAILAASGGKGVWFSLCGWYPWYSAPDASRNYSGGASVGNSWRIAGDGDSTQNLAHCMDNQAASAPFAGASVAVRSKLSKWTMSRTRPKRPTISIGW